MYRFNWLTAFLLLSLACPAFAETVASNTKSNAAIESPPPKPKPKRKHFRSLEFTTFALTFLSWNEDVKLATPSANAKVTGNLYGNSLMWEEEYYNTPRFGYLLQGALLIGLANVGATQSSVPYHLVDQHWWGINTSVRAAYRITTKIIVSAGPNALYRQLTLPVDAVGMTASSGSTVNVGATADLRMRLSNAWELREEIGSLFIKAHTFWSLGFGYKF